MELGGREGGNNLEGVGGVETVIRKRKKNLFSIGIYILKRKGMTI